MIDNNDWRLQNQQDWLAGVLLAHGRFQQTSEGQLLPPGVIIIDATVTITFEMLE